MAVIKHADFEDGLDGFVVWYGGVALDRSNVDPLAGSWSLLITDTDGGSGGAFASGWPGTGGIVGGQDYTVTVMHVAPAGVAPTLTLQWKDSGGGTISSSTATLPEATTPATTSNRFTAPANAAMVRAAFEAELDAGASYRIDEFLIEDAQPVVETHSFTASLGISAAATAAQSKSTGLAASPALTVGTTTAQAKTAQASAGLAMSMGATAAQSKTVELHTTTSITVLALASTGADIPPSPERTVHVQPESRRYVVPAESRLVTVKG